MLRFYILRHRRIITFASETALSRSKFATAVMESAVLVAVRAYNALTALARQNSTLYCFENTLLVPICESFRLSGVNCRDYIIVGP